MGLLNDIVRNFREWIGVQAAPQEPCLTMTVHEQALLRDEGYAARREEAQRQISLYSKKVAPPAVMTVRTVVHLVHYRDGTMYVSDKEVHDQLAALNLCFAAAKSKVSGVPLTWKKLTGDSMIRFELATHDPDGKPTTGIERRKSNTRAFGSEEDTSKPACIKRYVDGGLEAWDATRYFNVWVGNLLTGAGYARYPGALPPDDGVVVDYLRFGLGPAASSPNNLGHHGVHEAGHWLNLRHLWEDRFLDTPSQTRGHYGQPPFPCCPTPGANHMYMNFMDYPDDNVTCFFTPDQRAEMLATLTTVRSGVWY